MTSESCLLPRKSTVHYTIAIFSHVMLPEQCISPVQLCNETARCQPKRHVPKSTVPACFVLSYKTCIVFPSNHCRCPPIYFNIMLSSTPRSSKFSPSAGPYMHFPSAYACQMHRLSYPPSYDQPNNIWRGVPHYTGLSSLCYSSLLGSNTFVVTLFSITPSQLFCQWTKRGHSCRFAMSMNTKCRFPFLP